jgi:hypothetical protein
MFNLKHSSLRFTIERVFVALKNRSKVLDQPFHTYDTHVKLVLACSIPYNSILDWGKYDMLPYIFVPNEVDTDYGMDQGDNEA